MVDFCGTCENCLSDREQICLSGTTFTYGSEDRDTEGHLRVFRDCVGSKLRWRYTLDMWDFNADVPGFFLNYLAVAGLYVVIGLYGMRLVISRRRSRDRAPSHEA